MYKVTKNSNVVLPQLLLIFQVSPSFRAPTSTVHISHTGYYNCHSQLILASVDNILRFLKYSLIHVCPGYDSAYKIPIYTVFLKKTTPLIIKPLLATARAA